MVWCGGRALRGGGSETAVGEGSGDGWRGRFLGDVEEESSRRGRLCFMRLGSGPRDAKRATSPVGLNCVARQRRSSTFGDADPATQPPSPAAY